MNYKIWKRSRRVPDKINLKSGDPVIVITGKSKGQRGSIKSVDRDRGTVIIEGINEGWDFRRGGGPQNPGEVRKVSLPIHVSNVMYYSDKIGKGVRIGYKVIDGVKKRYCHKHNLVLDN